MNKKLKEFAVQSDLWRMLDEYSWELVEKRRERGWNYSHPSWQDYLG
jgi:hypothetical protein